jgi:anti-sigma factor RsiW
MECHEVRQQLSAWLDHELPETAAAALAVHVEKCAACRQEWLQLQALDAALDNLAAPVPPDLAEKVLARLRPPRRQRWQSVAVAACLVLGLALGGTMTQVFYGPAAPTNRTGTEMATLDVFHDFPQGSLGAVVASYQPVEGNGNLQ